MTYEQAFQIGSKVEGYIKCTYAMIHNVDKGRLFSLQHGQAQRPTNTPFDTLQNAISDVQYDWSTQNADAKFYYFDVPVVKTDEYVADERVVPVKLTAEACEIIEKQIRPYYVPETTYTLWQVYEDFPASYWAQLAFDPLGAAAYAAKYANESKGHKPGDRVKVWSSKSKEEIEKTQKVMPEKPEEHWHYEVTLGYESHPLWDDLKDAIVSGDTVYVKKVAIDWCPTNIKNVSIIDPTTGKLIKLNDAIDAAEQRLKQAKTLLLASGLTVLI